jgi:hypothetical protein
MYTKCIHRMYTSNVYIECIHSNFKTVTPTNVVLKQQNTLAKPIGSGTKKTARVSLHEAHLVGIKIFLYIARKDSSCMQ